MTSLGEVFDEIQPEVEIWGLNDHNGVPLVRAKLDIASRDDLPLPTGEKGDKGDDGDQGGPFDFRGYITDVGQLPASLGFNDVGYTLADTVTRDIHYWDGSGWIVFPDALSVAGEPGPSADLSIGTVTTSPAGGSPSLLVSGSPPSQVLDLTIPRGDAGPIGPIGPSAAIVDSTDYDDTNPPQDGDTLVWSSALQKWMPQDSRRIAGPWSLIHTDFNKSTHSTSATLASITIPAQTFDYRPLIEGIIRIHYTNQSDAIRVKVTHTQASSIVASGVRDFGANDTERSCVVQPFSTSKLTPASSSQVVSAGNSATYEITGERFTGSGNWNVTDSGFTSIFFWLIPV